MNARMRAISAITLCALGFSLASGARYQLIEPAHLTYLCDGGSREAWCTVRSWIIQAFVHQRIGWVALGIAALAFLTGWRPMAGMALFLASAGLVLYTTELSAPAALLALLVFVREGQVEIAASSNSRPP